MVKGRGASCAKLANGRQNTNVQIILNVVLTFIRASPEYALLLCPDSVPALTPNYIDVCGRLPLFHAVFRAEIAQKTTKIVVKIALLVQFFHIFCFFFVFLMKVVKFATLSHHKQKNCDLFNIKEIA